MSPDSPHWATRLFCVSLLLVAVSFTQGQTKEQLKSQAESQLSQMTPEEIDARIKQLGLTREEATKKAAELGISLEQYLGSAKAVTPPAGGAAATPTITTTPPAPSTTPIVVEQRPPVAPLPLSPAGLPYFGYDIFATVPSAFEPTAVGPVDPQYVIGPEDVLRVSVWGQVEFQNELTVDKEGRIFIPTIGQVLVSGLTLEQAYQKLLKQMSRSYSGLVAKNPTVWLDVTLARLRPKRVFIMGEVGKPGGYTVSSYANVFNSLYSVGGPTVKGSLREVRVVRGDNVIAKVDLYSYLTGADRTNDIRIQSNDIVFVPIRGKTVSIRGGVQRPATYELKDGEDLGALLRFSGGLLSTAYTSQAQIDRIKPYQKRTGGVVDRIVVDVDLRDVLKKPEKDVPLYDGDEVQIFSVLDEKENYVTISGSVWRPGRYQLGAIQTLRDLIKAAEGIQPKTYMELAHLVRYNEDRLTRRIITLDLRFVLEDSIQNRTLVPRDSLIVYSTEMTEVKSKHVTIRGEVKSPGQYSLHKNMVLEDLVALAGGYTEAAERLKAEVSRVMPGGLPGDTLSVILHPPLPATFSAEGRPETTEDANADSSTINGHFPLHHRDEVLILPNPQYKVQQDVSIGGDIKYPGVYSLKKRDERLSDLLVRAGGPTVTSYLGGGQLFRRGLRVSIDFEKAYRDKDKVHDVVLFAKDSIIIPPKPHTVVVTGQVNKPGLLSFIEGNSVGDYLDRAGGLTDSALCAILTKPTGESKKVNFGLFRSDPEVPEGSAIDVLKVPPPPPLEKGGESLATTVKDIFAIVTSAVTVAYIVWQTSK